MNGKRLVSLISVVGVAAGLMWTALPALGQSGQPAQGASVIPLQARPPVAIAKLEVEQAAGNARPSPAWVTYGFFFSHLAHLDEVADEQEALGNRTEADGWRSYEQRAVGLTEEEGRFLKQVAYACNQAVKDQDAKTQGAVKAFREDHGRSAWPRDVNSDMPPDPARLWDERTQLIETHIDQLRSRFGTDAFEKLDRRIQATFKSSVKVVPHPSTVSAPGQTDSIPQVHVWSHSFPQGLQAVAECGTSMIDPDTQRDYRSVTVGCAFWRFDAPNWAQVWPQASPCTSEFYPYTFCRSPTLSLLPDKTYATTGSHGITLKQSLCAPNWSDPSHYLFAADGSEGQPLTFLNDGDVTSHGAAVCWSGSAGAIAFTESSQFTTTPKIKISPLGGDFGRVTVGTSVDGTFFVQNVGEGVLSGSATTNPPYTIEEGGSYNLVGGQSQAVTVRFKPTLGGTFNGNVTFTGGGGATGTVTGVGVVVRSIGVAAAGTTAGVSISVSPADNDFKLGGTTPFTLKYDDGTVVTLTAPSTSGVNTFSNWTGYTCSPGTTCTVTVNADNITVTAVYGTPSRTLNVYSSPASGAAITVTPTDKNNLSNGSTPFSRLYDINKLVTLTASPVAGYTFSGWVGCDSATGVTCNVTMSADKNVTAAYAVIPTRTLTVTSSNPSTGVSITVSPNDKNGLGNGTTQFTRTFNNSTVVTLVAATMAGNNTFANWSGCDSSPGATCTITMGADKTVTANYVAPRTLTVASSNPISGVAVTVTPNDRSGLGNGTTLFTRSYNNNVLVTLTAPLAAGGNPFSNWSGCDGTSGTVCTVTMIVDKTVTAVYAPPRTLTVASSPAGVSIPVSPTDRNGKSNGTTPFTLSYFNNQAVTLTAPSTAPGGYTSPIWSGCNSSSGNTCTVTMDADKTVTAIYRMPVILVSRIRGIPPHIVRGTSATATVEMGAAAPAGGLAVSLSLASVNPAAASVPSTVFVPAGSTVSNPFTVTTSSTVTTSTLVTITATYQSSSASASFYVDPPLTVTGISGQGDRTLGTAITNTVSVTGGVAPYSYAFYYYYGGIWNLGQAYSSSNTWTWTPSKAGSYSMQVWVKNAGSTAAWDAYNGYSFNVTPPPATVSVAWVKPAEVTWGPAGTLTVAGYAQNATGGVQMYWKDRTISGNWTPVAYMPAPDATHVWYNSIPSSNNCHTYDVYAVYSGVTSAVFTYTGISSGYCHEAARVIWIQPQTTAGFGPPGNLIVAGSASGAPSGTGVRLFWRDVTAGGGWNQVGYEPPPDGSNIWYNSFPANFSHAYSVYIVYDVVSTSAGPCTYAGNGSISWCP